MRWVEAVGERVSLRTRGMLVCVAVFVLFYKAKNAPQTSYRYWLCWRPQKAMGVAVRWRKRLTQLSNRKGGRKGEDGRKACCDFFGLVASCSTGSRYSRPDSQA